MPTTHIHHIHNPLQKEQTTILVVDDDVIIRELCQQTLKDYRVILAADSEEALRLYEQNNVDLILSDIMMPGGSGINLLKKVKLLDPNAAFVIMTGFSDSEVILSALKEDADDFINKPLNFFQLKASIKKTLERKTLKKELAHIKSSDEFKNSFLSLISHKLRTPITGISLFLQNLSSGTFKTEDPIFEEYIALATDEAKYLDHLVTDLLAFSQVIVAGTDFNPSIFDLNEIVAKVLMECRQEHCKFDFDIETASSLIPPMKLDVPKISFAIHQIIDNAFKFSGDHGQVILKIDHYDNSAFIVVSDNGIGIPESEIPKIFEKFYQIDSDHTGQIRGFGLGLYYARDFIKQHGGSITLDSEPGLGTTVTINLPIN